MSIHLKTKTIQKDYSMKALTIILRIRSNYENAYIGMLQTYYKHKHNVNAYITHLTSYKDYSNNIVNAYIICYIHVTTLQ